MPQITENSILTFGIYKGIPLKDVPAAWLISWHSNEFSRGPLRNYISENMNSIKAKVDNEIIYVSDKLKK